MPTMTALRTSSYTAPPITTQAWDTPLVPSDDVYYVDLDKMPDDVTKLQVPVSGIDEGFSLPTCANESPFVLLSLAFNYKRDVHPINNVMAGMQVLMKYAKLADPTFKLHHLSSVG